MDIDRVYKDILDQALSITFSSSRTLPGHYARFCFLHAAKK
jgi:hypothetical protein